MFVEEDYEGEFEDDYIDTFDKGFKSTLFEDHLKNFKLPEDDYNDCFIQSVTGLNQFPDGYLEVVKNEWTPSIYFPSLYLRELLLAVRINRLGVPEYHFGPAVRKNNKGNIWGTKSVWVKIGNPDRKLSFIQRQEEASIMLENFKSKLQTYDLSPTYILSSGKEYTVFFLLKNLSLYPFSDWYVTKRALSKMANTDMPENAITELVSIPGSVSTEMYEQKQYVEIIVDNYTNHSNGYLIRDFQNLVRDYK